MRVTRANIYLSHLRHNLAAIRARIGKGKSLCLAVKANAYGHGAVGISRAAREAGVEFLAVATLAEGQELREAGIGGPILLLGLISPPEAEEVVRNELSATVADSAGLVRLEAEAERQGVRQPVHLKVDTGMGRIGCPPDEALRLARQIDQARHLTLEGVFTHFPVADEPDNAFTAAQIGLFNNAVAALKSAGIDPGLVHAANSGGILYHPESHLDMVRPGILAYGYLPDPELEPDIDLKPVMELETSILFLKTVEADTPISYGSRYRTPCQTRIATIPVGYADGLARRLSGKAQALLRERRYPIAGTICMDQAMLDIGTGSPAALYDKVYLFGPRPGCPTARDLARWLGTIPYEVTCGISARVPRHFLDE